LPQYIRTLVAAMHQMLKIMVQMSNQMSGVMKTSGLIVPKSAGSVLEGHIRTLLATNTGLERIILPMLEACSLNCASVSPS